MRTFDDVLIHRLRIKIHWRVAGYPALFLFLLFVSTQVGYGQVKFPGGRIAISFDGNVRDKDDWGASAMSLAMLDAAGLSDRVEVVEINNILGYKSDKKEASIPDWEDQMIASTMAGVQGRFRYDPSLFFDAMEDSARSRRAMTEVINASSASSPLWFIAAGRMETLYRALAAANASARQHVHVISHSSANNNYTNPVQGMIHTDDDVKDLGVVWHQIKDQNRSRDNSDDNDFSTPNFSKWSWLKNHSDDRLQWLYSRNGFDDKFDVSDAGMVYWLLSGGPNGGCQDCGPTEARALLSNLSTPPKSNEDPPSVVDCVFKESSGLVVVEAEAGQADGWAKKKARSGYTGSGYLEWTGSDHFNAPGNGTINYRVYINQPGTYRFQWRSRNVTNGNSTEHNDTWLRFPDATEFYGQKGNNKVYPHGSGKSPNPNGAGSKGWFKIYTNGGAAWNWQTTTSDRQNYPIFVSFDNPGEYTLQVSGRSNGHAIDRMVLSHSSRSASEAASVQSSPSGCHSKGDNTAPTVNAGADKTLTLPQQSITLTASASDADGKIASYQWSKVSGPAVNLDGAKTRQLTLTNLASGRYTFKVTVKDNQGASASDQVQVTVKAEPSNALPTADITSPSDNATFTVGSSFTIQAKAQDTDGSVAKVMFYDNGVLIDEDENAPYTCQVKDASARVYKLTAVAVDDEGAKATSTQVKVVVEDEQPSEPVVHAIPGRIEAENYTASAGVQIEPTEDVDGNSNIGWIDNGDYTDYRVNVSQAGSYRVAFRVASARSGGTITITQGGNALGRVVVKNTGSWQNWQTISTEVSLSAGEQTLRIRFSGGDGYLFNINYLNATKISDSGQSPDEELTLTLYSARNNAPIKGFNPIAQGAIIDLSEVGEALSIVAEAPAIELDKVQFDYNGQIEYQTEFNAPYAIQGDDPGFKLNSWTPTLGDNHLTVTAYLDGGGTEQISLNFTVINGKTTGNSLNKLSSFSEPTEGKTLQVTPVHDAYLENGTRHNHAELRAELDQRTTYLMFDLKDVPGEVAHAKLALTVASDPGYGTLSVATGSHSDWTENNLSEDNQPLVSKALNSIEGEFSSGQTYTFDLSSIPVGDKLTLIVSHPSGNDVAFASKEYDNASLRPTLIVTTSENTRTVAEESKAADQSAPVALEDMLDNVQIPLYPNPANELLHVKVNAESNYQIASQSGRIVQSGVADYQHPVQVSELKEGLYYIRLTTEQGVKIQRFFVHR